MTGNVQNGGRFRISIIGLMLVGMLLGTSLATAADVASSAPAASDPEDATANQIAREVFSGEEYWWKRKSDVKATSAIGQFFSFVYEYLIRPVLKAIWDLIVWIYESIFGGMKLPRGDWSAGIPFLWTIVILLVALVVWRIIVTFRSGSTIRRELVPQTSVETLPQPDLLLDQARTALAQGDHRSAIRLAFLALLAWFQDRGQLKYDTSRSNREYQRDLHGWPESATSFRAAAEPFERCWYGGRDLDADQVQNVIALCLKHIQSTKGSE